MSSCAAVSAARLAGAGLAVAFAAAPAAAGPGTFHVVAESGDQVAGLGPLRTLGNPLLNNRGDVLFAASGTRDGAPKYANEFRGYFLSSTTGGDLTVAGLEGQAVLGTPHTVRWFLHSALDEGGRAVLTMTLTGAGVDSGSQGVAVADRERPLTALAYAGQPVAGDETRLTSFLNLSVGDAGDVAFLTRVVPPDAHSRLGAYLIPAAGPARPIAVAGEPAPGGGRYHDLFRDFIPAVNASGEVAFYAGLAEGGGPMEYGEGLFRSVGRPGAGGGLVTVARVGQAAPGGGVLHNIQASVQAPEFNNAGQVAFTARLSGGVDAQTGGDEAVYLGDGQAPLRRIVGAGDVLPNGVVADKVEVARLNDAGQVLVRAGPQSGPQGLYRFGPDGPRLIARAGAALPGGGEVQPYHPKTSFNDRGQVIVHARLAEDWTAPMPHTTDALLLHDDELGLIEVVRDDGEFLGGTLESFNYHDLWGRGRNGFNDAGQIAFGYTLTDGRYGVAVWTPPRREDLLPGDANLDGRVTIADFAVLRANFGSDLAYFTTGDFDGDSAVTIADFALLRANFGGSAAQAAELDAWAAAVPEPAGLAVVAAAGLGLLRRRV